MFRLVWPFLLIALSGRAICGHNLSQRIIGGTSVDIKQAPYQANILVDGSPICSGAIISGKTILTAAGCVYGCPTSSVWVRVGSSARESGGTLARVCGIHIHPQYSYYRYDNNLAILELCDSLTFSDSVKEIQVADKLPEDNSLAEVSGWGSTSWWGSWWDRIFGSLPDQLQSTTVSIYNREQCAWDLSFWFWLWDYGVSEQTLCTFDYEKAGCTYDTGAPLVKDKKLLGILSYAGCTKYPDVYANLIGFESWLSQGAAEEDASSTRIPAETRSTTKSTPISRTTTLTKPTGSSITQSSTKSTGSTVTASSTKPTGSSITQSSTKFTGSSITQASTESAGSSATASLIKTTES